MQVRTTGSNCSWTATDSDASWIAIPRTGALYTHGDGPLVLTLSSNKDENFGGCITHARTGQVTVTEESSGAQSTLEIMQSGSPGPFVVPTGCSVSSLPYGTTLNASIGQSDCTVGNARARYYSFQALVDHQISINMRGGRFVSGGLQVPLFRLYGPGGGQILGAGANVVVDDPHVSGRNLFCSGTYTVQVTSLISPPFNSTGLGNFTLRLDSN